MATLACHRYSISWRNVRIPLNRRVHFRFWRFNFSLYNVIGWKKQHSCSHALYLENTSLRCTSLSNNMYGWHIQYFQRDSFLLTLVRHNSYKNDQYAIQGCNTPSRKCTAYSWRIQPIFVQYSLQPIISFERGSNCAEHAINLSNMCLYFYIFTKVQYTIHCRKQGCFQDAWSSQKKTCSWYSSLFRKCMSKVSVALSYAKCCVSLQVCYCFSTRQRF